MKKQGVFLGIPYNWNKPTWERFKETLWNKKDHRLFVPRVFGWGYAINFYELIYKRTLLFSALLLVILVGAILCIKQAMYVNKAHTTFENYYAFRGCTQLLQRTSTYGICKTASGETIKIVKYQGKWYLDGDLPCGFLCP